MTNLQTIQFWLLKSSVLFLIASLPATAQIVPDSTLPNNSIVTPQGNTTLIEGGTQTGSNLFHSFEQFSVPTGGGAFFNNALDIQNIISRVTGSSISNIDGLIRANGAANLFLLNPNGMAFGSNAQLNIGGSFVASTASSLRFADGKEFSATSPQTTPLLTISVPIGLGFASNPGRIQVQGLGQGTRTTTELIDTTVGLRVQPNQTLALVGGDVALEGGTLKTAGGRIELGSVTNPGVVSLTPIDSGWALGYEDVPTFGDIQLSGQATVDASGAGGGDIQVQGRRVTLTNGSQIEASTLGAEPGGTLAVTALESVEVIGRSNDDQFQSGLFTTADLGTTGAGGNLTLETGRLIVRDGAQISATTYGTGSAGNLAVNAKESVELSGTSAAGRVPSRLSTQVRQEATGAGGNLTLETGRLIVRDGTVIGAITYGAGSAGNLSVNAKESVEVSGTSADGRSRSALTTTVQRGATGAGGNLTLKTGRLIVQDGAQIGAATYAAGSAGNLAINAKESVELSGTSADGRFRSGLFTSVERRPTEKLSPIGAGGNLTLETGRLIVRDGAQIQAATYGTGSAGNLTINAKESVELSGTSTDGRYPSWLSARTTDVGDAGNLRIETGQLTVRDKAEVIVGSTGSGRAGQIEVQAHSIQLENQGKITSETASGQGGQIALQVQDLLLMRNNSSISTTAGTAGAGGHGGNITMDTGTLTALENSDITANAFEGRGGNIQINTQGLFRSPDSDITASSQLGINGTVEINTPDVDPSQGLVNLPAELVDVSNQIAQSCPGGVGPRASKFVITGRGGIPENPQEMLNSETFVEDWGMLTRSKGEPQNELMSQRDSLSDRESDPVVSVNPASSEPAPIVEATGWVTNAKGEVFLIAEVPNTEPTIPWFHSSSCHAP